MALTFYTVGSICAFIKCAHKIQGTFFFLKVDAYKLQISETFHVIHLESIDIIPVLSDAEYDPITAGESKVTDMYSSIYLNSNSGKHRDIYEQIVRLGSCFKQIRLRPLVEYNNLICEMGPDFCLKWYKEDVPNESIRTWYLVVPLDFFYKERAGFGTYIDTVEEKLIKILENVQQKNTAFIQGCKLASIVRDHEQTVGTKKRKITASIAELFKTLGDLNMKEKKYLAHKEKFQEKSDDNILALSALSKNIDGVRELAFETLKRIQDLKEDLKKTYLENDEVLYNASRYISNLQNYGKR